MKRTVILNGKEIESEEQFHTILAAKLNIGDYYGKNVDAMWDCLSSFNNDEANCKIIWKDHLYSKNKIGDEDFGLIIDVFNDLKAEHSEFELVLD